MKKLVKMSRAVGSLEGLYNHLNNDFFGGKLPVPIITVQSKKGSWGHCSVSKVWKRADGETYEMNIAAEKVGTNEVEEIIDTMLHEMVHLYCRENGIQEVSRGGTYHNKRFKQEAERVGLITYQCGQYGWNTQGKGNDKLIEYALSIGFYGIDINRETPCSMQVGTVPTQAPSNQGGGKAPSSTRKYQCPICYTSFRATKDLTNCVSCVICSLHYNKLVLFEQV